MPQNAATSRRGPIANCVLVLRDLKLSSQELHGTLHDVVARTGAAGKDAAVHDWRTYIQRYDEVVSAASRAASQLRALIRTYLLLQQQKHESKIGDMVVELSNLRSILENYHSDTRKLCDSLQSDIAAFYGRLTPEMLESSSSIGICEQLVAEPEHLPLDATRHNVEHIPKISPGDVSGTHVKTTMLWVLEVVFRLRLKKPRNKNGEPSPSGTGRSQSAGSPPAGAMSDSNKTHETQTPNKHRISLPPCGRLRDFDDSTDIEPTSQMQNGPALSERPSVPAQGRPRTLPSHWARAVSQNAPDAVRMVSTDDIRANQLKEETFRDLVKAIDSVLQELDRLAPRFDTYSELAQHLRNEITAYINAFSGYQALQTLVNHIAGLASDSPLEFEPSDGLPSDNDIISQCSKVYKADLNANIRGTALLDLAGKPFWVKFGHDVTQAEARTQDYVGRAVRARNGADNVFRVPVVYRFFKTDYKGYIAMEFIEGKSCGREDADRVADAVRFLVTIRAPDDQLSPGPVGGGPICHDFFVERRSGIAYPSLESLSSHINGILSHEKRRLKALGVKRIDLRHVDFGPEVEQFGLRLCLSDMNCANFMKDAQGNIVVIDFGATCFLPISFVELALQHFDPFTRLIRQRIVPFEPTQADMLGKASSVLARYQTNRIGLADFEAAKTN
ncbi:hypothetical protein PYCCODRAFT_1465448 [Trametes coccinea BRFM310]|uniref:Aminoglycoside phosphotransferase domain-containing protein n=1 Tax=Trametes coccinea (strain BRFM310) TaxID=1353009 RepID=A0A1Y2IV15_TRAC3|nr:hypothetical protein PYCCODRAFT_1465448 [Trametes coccinea BRFM310]